MSLLDTVASLPLTRAIGWTVLHSLWQATLIAALAGVALALLRDKSSRARYAVCCAGMALMLLVPLATLVTLLKAVGALRVLEITEAFTDSAAFAGWQRLSPLLPWITLVWLVGFSLLQCRTFVFWMRAHRMKRLHTRPLSPDWQRSVSQLCDRIGIRRTILVVESTLAEVPMLIGWLAPVILVPTSALCGLTPRQLRAVLAHELAHVRRHDALVNLIQAAMESFLFFHPAVWWISDRMRAEREYCCDDVAVEVCGDTLCYARALSTLENLRGAPQPAIAANGGSLMSRIFRLVGTQPATSRSARRHGLSSLLLAAFLSVLFAVAGIATAGGSGNAGAVEPKPEPVRAVEGEPSDKAQLLHEIARREAALERLERALELSLQAEERNRQEALRDLELSFQAEERNRQEAQRDLELSLQNEERNEREALLDVQRALEAQQSHTQQERDALMELEQALQLQQRGSQSDAENLREELDKVREAEEREARERARRRQSGEDTSDSADDLERQLAERDRVIEELNLQLAELQKLTLLRKLRKLKPGQQTIDASRALEKLERKQLKLEAAEEKDRIKALKKEAKRNKKREPAL